MSTKPFYIYGKKPVEELLLRNPENVIRIFVSDTLSETSELSSYTRNYRIPMNKVGRKQLKEYVGDVNDQGVVALVRTAPYQEFNTWLPTLNTENNPAVVILDHIEDTHNFGAILRTAAAFGVAGVIVAKDHQAPLNGTVFKTSAGAAITIPVVQVSNINQAIKKLQDAGFWIAALETPKSENDIIWKHTFDTPMAFVAGSEGKGISHKTKEYSDFTVSLPLESTVESLNVSVAVACVLSEWKRQQLG